METAILVAARLESERFPGKVLTPILGKPMLLRVFERLAKTKLNLILATPDRRLAVMAKKWGIDYHISEPDDVLQRNINAAEEFGLDRIIRITADCPLIDPWMIVRLNNGFNNKMDYASNCLERTYPWGVSAEIIHLDVLKRINRMTWEKKYHEHVTLYVRENLDLFVTWNLKAINNYLDMNWMVDYKEDVKLIERIYEWEGNKTRAYYEIAKFVRHDDECMAIATRNGIESEDYTAPNAEYTGSASTDYGWYRSAKGAQEIA